MSYDTSPLLYNLYRTAAMTVFPAHMTRNIASIIKHRKINFDHRAAVLIAGHDVIIPAFILDPLVAKINSELEESGIRTDWILNAKIKDLKEVLEDENYQSIVTFGHGDRSNWLARDGAISQEEISEFYGNRPKKTGYWFQQSCGSKEGMPLGIDVMQNPEENCKFYRNQVHAAVMMWAGLPKNSLNSVRQPRSTS